MAHEFDDRSAVHVHRDHQGVARDLLHADEPYISSARTPQLAAHEYLEKFGPMLGIAPEQLRHLGLSPEQEPIDAPVEYRFLDEKVQFDTTTLVFSQTCLGLPIREAGLAIHMRREPQRIISAQSTLHPHVHLTPPSGRAVARLRKLDAKTLAQGLGLAEEHHGFHVPSLRIKSLRLIVYRYDAGKRAPLPEDPTSLHGHHGLALPLPPVPDEIEDGRHYVAAEVVFVLSTSLIPDLHWIAVVEAATLVVLFVRPLIDDVDGLVFEHDPITDNGGPLPNAGNAQLNPVRTAVLLRGLVPPAGGTYALTGDLVQLQDTEPPPVAPPTEPVGTDFDFNVRTDNFAAVNAYYHCDRFFRLVGDLGFDIPTYFGGTLFPSSVDHRGSITNPGGLEINAHCLGNGAFGILRTTFMLADLSNTANPIGLACDWRVVLHELGGHGVLYNHVNGPNFGFAHSAGDSFGAVLSDPETQAPDRFLTFPWVGGVINRRHDRPVAGGWAWGGVNDTGGYNSEQILCTTHFRIYRAIGGDSTEVPMRHFSARHLPYLILRAIGTLTPATNPSNALGFATAEMTAAMGDWASEGELGGYYWKVIRWAYEKQGLFQPLGAPVPVTTVGAPPPIDVFIDDGRQGEYQYGPANPFPWLQRFWETTEIWNRLEPDGQPEHQTPMAGRTNHAYVHVRNRGTQTANGVRVHGYHCRPSAGLVWPDDWQPMMTASLTVAGGIPSGGKALVGPFAWRPQHRGHDCMFMSVSAPGDRANNDPASAMPCAAGPAPLWQMVPCDNNLGLRAVIPVPGGGRRRALVRAFRKRRFWASNPLPRTAKMEIRPMLPGFLLTRGWAMVFDNPGAGSFSLGPRDTRVIRPRLIGGQSFTAAEIATAGTVTIMIVVLADGLVVGGLTFVLDPKLHQPPHEEEEKREEEEDEDEEKREEEEHHRREERDGGRLRRIRLEIDLD
jgi:zinc metalloprotease ZmpB